VDSKVISRRAVGRRRRLRERRPAPVHLDTAAQIEALLEAAAGLDRDVRQRCGKREAIATHKLRHTFASVLIACGEDPISLMRQIGHTDPTSPSASTPT
jgi:integrase